MRRKADARILYLDAGAGISGDMFLGALTDVISRIDPDFDLGRLLSGIALEGWELSVERGVRCGIAGLKVDVRGHAGGESHHGHEGRERGHSHPHRGLAQILEMLSKSDISPEVREKTAFAFTLLAETEGEIHGVSPGEIHFHEVGAVDSIVDITGAMLVMEYLGWPEVISSPVNVGSGTVKCAHGILPVPAPATAEILKGMKVYSAGAPMERTTPTGALLLRVLVGEEGFRPLPEGTIISSGFGLGGRDTPELPNVLRTILYEPSARAGRFVVENPSLLEANIDDMNPQDFALAMERLLEAGALDSWCENILMKKGRPAVKLCCLVREEDVERCAETMMRETTTIGVRIVGTKRMSLERSLSRRPTPIGEVAFKSVSLDGRTLRSVPEYEDIMKIAREKKLTILDVRRAAELGEKV
ncbi:MAG: nickel pincer cofactor biosynthesis protein LarC [Synergistaceae bacterium]|nr:nickel pincer cofactor biosynthesis protein LarC [Synergistaceae bacterium]